MHPIEGLIPLWAGVFSCLLATGKYLKDQQEREKVEEKVPLIKNKKLMWAMTIFLWVWGAMVVLGIPNAHGQQEITLEQIADEINKSLPMLADADTRADKVTAKGKALVYHMSLVNHRLEDIEKDSFFESVDQLIKSNACANSDYRRFLKMGITIKVNYQTADEKDIGTVQISPELCGL